MTVAWQEHDLDYFRAIGIEVDEAPLDTRPAHAVDYLIICAGLFISLLSGFVLYGILLAGAWVLRHLGVNITGV